MGDGQPDSTIDLEGAIERTLKFVRVKYADSPIDMSKVCIDRKGIIETSLAWIVPWNDCRFIVGGEWEYAMQGVHPIVVFKHGGSAWRLPTLTKSEYARFKSKGPHGTMEHRLASLVQRLQCHDGVVRDASLRPPRPLPHFGE
jgi:hypothetical protein